MKRALAIIVMVCMSGLVGFSQIALKGKWTAEVCLLPEMKLASTLDLTYTLAGFDLTSTFKFDKDGLSDKEFSLKGALGPFALKGKMVFIPRDLRLKDFTARPDPADIWLRAPAYRSAELIAKFDFAGIKIKGEVDHIFRHVWFTPMARVKLNPPCYLALVLPAIDAWWGATEILVYRAGVLIGVERGNFVVVTIGAYDPITKTYAVTPAPPEVAYFNAKYEPDPDAYRAHEDKLRLYYYHPTFTRYSLTLELAPVKLDISFIDVCPGITFEAAKFTLKDIELCCGIKLTTELAFDKCTGFDSLTIKGINIPLCCGVSFDVEIKFETDKKSVKITPKFAGIAEACFTVWGAATITGISIFDGIRVDAFRIRCVIAECNYFEYVHAFDPTALTIPKAIRDKFLAACRENEYVELGFCGPGCCGGRWEAMLRIMMSTTPQGGLFGITRFMGEVKIPIMVGFTVDLKFGMPVVPASTPCFHHPKGKPSFCLGWTFKF